MNWTQHQIDELMRLNGNGQSYSELARLFRVSRSAISGCIHRERVRLGLLPDRPRIRNRSKADKSNRRKDMLTLPVRAEFVLSAYHPPAVTKPDEGQLASIVDVTGCKWPVRDDPEFVGGIACCNHATDEGKPYCPYHTQESIATYSRTLIRKTVKDAIKTVKRAA